MVSEVEGRRNRWSPAVLAKMAELTQLISQEKFADEEPPVEMTWAEIEDIGHEVGWLTATEVNQAIQRQQAEKFDCRHACPQCGRQCIPGVRHRTLETRRVPLAACQPVCGRPSLLLGFVTMYCPKTRQANRRLQARLHPGIGLPRRTIDNWTNANGSLHRPVHGGHG